MYWEASSWLWLQVSWSFSVPCRTPQVVIAAAGFEADASTLKKVIQRRNVNYQHNHKEAHERRCCSSAGWQHPVLQEILPLLFFHSCGRLRHTRSANPHSTYMHLIASVCHTRTCICLHLVRGFKHCVIAHKCSLGCEWTCWHTLLRAIWGCRQGSCVLIWCCGLTWKSWLRMPGIFLSSDADNRSVHSVEPSLPCHTPTCGFWSDVRLCVFVGGGLKGIAVKVSCLILLILV